MTFQPIKAALDTLNVYPDGWENEPVKIEPNEPAPVEIQYDRKWVALLTMPSQEHRAHRHLTKISAMTPTVVYWPHVVKKVHMRGRRQLVDRPMSIFKGMLFVSIADGNIAGYNPFRDFSITPGIWSYVRDGRGAPAFIPDWEMAIVCETEANENRPQEPIKGLKFRTGDKVKITADIMNAWPPGTIARLNGDGSYNVEIPGLFGRVTTMRLLANQVEAV